MESYSRDTSYLIRQDFMRFSPDVRTTKGPNRKKQVAQKKHFDVDLEATRNEMMNDDGRGGLGKYKCPIF